MQVTFNLSDVFTVQSNALEDASVLRALLNALITSNLAYLEYHAAPLLYDAHAQRRVIYGRTEEWERIPDVLRRGYGDCKSLSAWRIAELIHNHTFGDLRPQPSFRWLRRNGSGVKDYHILVQVPTDGSFEDPSKILGMGRDENVWFGRNGQ